MKIKNSLLLPIFSAALLMSGCSTTMFDKNTDKDKTETSYKPLRDFTLNNNNMLDTFMLRENSNDNFSKVYFEFTMYNHNLVDNAVHMIDDRVTLGADEYLAKCKTAKFQSRYIKKNPKFGLFLSNSFGKNIKDTFADDKIKVKRDKKLVMLDLLVYNYDNESLKLTPQFIKENFKNNVAFWFNEDRNTIKPGAAERLVIVVGGNEEFKVKKSMGSTGLSFDTKRTIKTQDSAY